MGLLQSEEPRSRAVPAPSETARAKAASCFLVYCDGRRAAAAALDSAFQLMKPNTVIVAAAWDSPRRRSIGLSRPVSADDALEAARAAAERRGVPIRTLLLESDDLGRGLVERAAALGAEILFWGIDRAEVESGLNPAAEYVLRFSPSQVVLVGV